MTPFVQQHETLAPSACLLACSLWACGGVPATLATNARPPVDQTHAPADDLLLRDSHVVNVVTESESQYRVLVPLDDTVKDCSTHHCAPSRVQVLFEGQATLIFIDQYDHGAAQDAACKAGLERFLRVVYPKATVGQSDVLESALNVKLSSCYDGIRLANQNPVSWDPATSTLTVDWQSGPGSTERRETFHIGDER